MRTKIFHSFCPFELGENISRSFPRFRLVDVHIYKDIEYLRDELSTNSFLFINEAKERSFGYDKQLYRK